MLTDETTRFLLRVLKEKKEEDEGHIEQYQERAQRAVLPGAAEACHQIIQVYREELTKTDKAIEELQANRAG